MEKVDVEVFTECLLSVIDPYLPYVQKWYDEMENHSFPVAGAFSVEDAPFGLMYRFNASAQQSTIKGIQAYTFINIVCLKLPSAINGIRNMLEMVFSDPAGILHKGFRIFMRQGLVQTNNANKFLPIIPEAYYRKHATNGSWWYLTDTEKAQIQEGYIPKTLLNKFEKRLQNKNKNKK